MKKNTDPQGRTRYSASLEEMKLASEWMRGHLHSIHGPEQGEALYQGTPAKVVVETWMARSEGEA